MALWQTFANLGAGNQPLSLFDTLASQIAGCVTIPCTCTGTNTYALAPAPPAPGAAVPPVTSYTNYSQFAFAASAASTGSCTLNVSSIGAKKLFTASGNQAGNGDILNGTLYVVAFNSSLDTGNGGFIILSATPSSLTLPVTVPNGGTGVASFATAYGVLCAGTTSTGNVQVIASVGSSGNVLTSNGAGALPTFQAAGAGSGSLVSIVYYNSTQTITIPVGATKAFVKMIGGGGGAKCDAAPAVIAGAGAGAYLEKYLTGLTPGNTLAFTLGAGGTSAPGNGGNTTLASGSQTITTLTAGGGLAVHATAGSPVNNSSGGTSTNGDLNSTGVGGNAENITVSGPCVSGGGTVGGGAFGAPFPFLGQGATAGQGGAAAGTAGLGIIFWFT